MRESRTRIVRRRVDHFERDAVLLGDGSQFLGQDLPASGIELRCDDGQAGVLREDRSKDLHLSHRSTCSDDEAAIVVAEVARRRNDSVRVRGRVGIGTDPPT